MKTYDGGGGGGGPRSNVSLRGVNVWHRAGFDPDPT